MTRSKHSAAPLSRFAIVAALAMAPVAVMSADTAAASIPIPSRAAAFHWTNLRPSPLGPRSQPILAWTGKELIELGGLRKGRTTRDGAAYNPATGRWHKIAPMRVNVGFDNATTAWTGRTLFVTNGLPARAALYDPAANHWTTTPLPKAMGGMVPQASVWTGKYIVVAAADENHGRLAVAAYNPVTRRWRVITPRLPRLQRVWFAALAAAPGRVLLWAAWDRVKSNTSFAGVALSPQRQRWTVAVVGTTALDHCCSCAPARNYGVGPLL